MFFKLGSFLFDDSVWIFVFFLVFMMVASALDIRF